MLSVCTQGCACLMRATSCVSACMLDRSSQGMQGEVMIACKQARPGSPHGQKGCGGLEPPACLPSRPLFLLS